MKPRPYEVSILKTGGKGKPTISMADSMAEFGITQDDLGVVEDPVIE